MSETKRSRGRQPGSLKKDARRVAMKIRWTEAEVEAVREAATNADEDFSSFVRHAALDRCRKT